MKPPLFDHIAPRTLDEAVALLAAREGEAKLIAGGQSLMPLLNMRLARPAVLIDLGRVEGLSYIGERGDGTVAIGAMTTQRAVERSPVVARRQPLLHAATRFIAHPQIRNRGTVGGSLAHADPAAECPAVVLALDAEIDVVGPRGRRTIGAADFFVSYLTTVLEPAEVLAEIRLPARGNHGGWSFKEISRRRGDFALAGVAVTVELDRSGRIGGSRIVLFGVSTIPLRAHEAENTLAGEKAGEEVFWQAAMRAAARIPEPLDDTHASADYRRHLARVLTGRALAEAAARAVASPS